MKLQHVAFLGVPSGPDGSVLMGLQTARSGTSPAAATAARALRPLRIRELIRVFTELRLASPEQSFGEALDGPPARPATEGRGQPTAAERHRSADGPGPSADISAGLWVQKEKYTQTKQNHRPGTDDHRAERMLRRAVIARKISPCSKNERGASATAAYLSGIQTARKGVAGRAPCQAKH